MRRLAVVVTAVAVALGGAWLTDPSAAHAHAVLLSTDPFDGEVLDEPPGRVTLEFNEAVTSPLGGLRVYAHDGTRVDDGDAGRGVGPHHLEVGFERPLDPGTYVVTWRAVSADSHPVRGAFLFEVRGRGGSSVEVDPSIVAGLIGGGSEPGYEAAAAATRFLQYAAILVAAGGVLFLALVHDGDRAERARYLRLVRRAAAGGAVAIVAAVPVQAALATGLGRSAATNRRALSDVLGDQFGWAVLVGLVGLGLLVLGARRERTLEADAVAVLGGVVAASSLALVGHPVAAEPAWVVAGVDALHALAASAWVGGLLLLALTLRSRGRDDAAAVSAARLVRRFSTLALASVAVLAVAGAVLAWSEVRAVRALTSTDYGVVLLLKIGVVAAVLAVAGFNRFRLVPAVARQASGAAWHFLRATVRFELVGVTAALVLTTALVNMVPAKTEAGVVGVFSAYADLGDEGQINLVVDPNRAGRNEIHVYVIDETGRPAEIAEALELRLSMPERDIGPIARTPERAGPGHWVLAGRELSISGEWLITVVAQTSEFEQERASLEVFVNR